MSRMPRIDSRRRENLMRLLYSQGGATDTAWIRRAIGHVRGCSAINAWVDAGYVPAVPHWMGALHAEAKRDNKILFRIISYQLRLSTCIRKMGVWGLPVSADCATLIAAALADNVHHVRNLIAYKHYSADEIAVARTAHRMTLTDECDNVLASWVAPPPLLLPKFMFTPHVEGVTLLPVPENRQVLIPVALPESPEPIVDRTVQPVGSVSAVGDGNENTWDGLSAVSYEVGNSWGYDPFNFDIDIIY